jgi:CHAT domain-containing protein/predicted negative regulator of RcsB-dependent stress response
LGAGSQRAVAGAATVEQDLGSTRILLDSGAYADAERAATEVVARTGLDREAVSLEAARALDLLVEALTRNGKAAETNTLEKAMRAVRVKQTLLGPGHLEVAVALHNLSAVLIERGEFTAAIPLAEQALLIRTRLLGTDDDVVAESLEQFGFAEIRLERFASARERLARALNIRRKHAGNAPMAVARTVELLALLNQQLGDYATGLSLVNEAYTIRAGLAPGHPDLISLLHIRGDLLYLRGAIREAQSTWTEALAIGERTLGSEHPALSQILRKLALAADALGNRTDSQLLLDRAVKIGKRLLSPCHPEVIWLLNDAALSRQRGGDFNEARTLYQQELTTIGRCNGSPDATATALHNLALLAVDMGDLAEAERLHTRAIQVWSTGLGPNHPFVARGLDALAEVVAARGYPSKARALYERALDIRRRDSGSDGPAVAWTLTNLARVVSDAGNLVVARKYVDQAMAVYQTAGAFDEPDHLARLLELRGTLEERQGDLAAARSSMADALAERERVFGATHPLAAMTRAALAEVDFSRAAFDTALLGALSAEQSGRDHLRYTVRYLPERLALTYAAKRPRGLDLALSITASRVDIDPTSVFDSVVRSRGLVLDELATRARALSDLTPGTVVLNKAAIEARQRFANLVVRSLQEPVARGLVDEARQQKEEAERSLAAQSATARAELARASAGLAEVRRSLPTSSAIVSFVRYNQIPSPGRAQTVATLPALPSYAAFVVRSTSSEVVFVPLGPASTVETLVRSWRDEARGRSLTVGSNVQAERRYELAATRLRRVVWDPVATHLETVTRVFVVPDGALNLLAFAALPVGRNRFLLEEGPAIHYLSAERDLVMEEPNVEGRGHGLLALGGPAFFDGSNSAQRREDGSPATLKEASSFAAGPTSSPTLPSGASTSFRSNASGCGSFKTMRFQSLPGSLREAKTVATLYSQFGSEATATSVQLLTGSRATEQMFKLISPGRRVLHLATHGFFLGDECSSALAGSRSVGGLVTSSNLKTTTNGTTRPRRLVEGTAPSENPLILSGLALAGANRRAVPRPNEDDGILTAEEVAALDLSGVEWAVLSACDTGLGTVAAGEGVLGLRRAFQIAGARTVIMSLWSVEDNATQQWMEALYRARLDEHLDTTDAVREASLSLIRERRAKGQSTHPFYWAGFVAAGDWR